MSGIVSILVIFGLFVEQNVSLWVDERERERGSVCGLQSHHCCILLNGGGETSKTGEG